MFELNGAVAEYKVFLEEWENGEAYVTATTSGSTGTPKSIKLNKSDMEVSAHTTNTFFGIGRQSVLVSPLSCRYIAGKMMLVRAVTADCTLVVLPPSLTPFSDSLFRTLKQVDLMAVVPSQLSDLAGDKAAIAKIRNLIVGGAPLSPELELGLVEVGVNGFVTYGMTETCSHVALRRFGETSYKSLPGITFDTDIEGCLIIKRDSATPGILRVNDIVELISPYEFRWLGRADNVVNSGGLKVFPEQIEGILLEIFHFPFLIAGETDSKWGTRLVLITEKETSMTDKVMMESMKRILPSYSVPKVIYRISRLPLTSNGKVDRPRALKLIGNSRVSR